MARSFTVQKNKITISLRIFLKYKSNRDEFRQITFAKRKEKEANKGTSNLLAVSKPIRSSENPGLQRTIC